MAHISRKRNRERGITILLVDNWALQILVQFRIRYALTRPDPGEQPSQISRLK